LSRLLVVLAAAASAFSADALPAAAQAAERPGVRFVRSDDNSPPHALRVAGVLDDADLNDALRSGLPLRLRFRIELWRDRWIDALTETRSWTTTLLFDPLDRVFIARDERDGQSVLAVSGSFEDAVAAVHRDHPLEASPQRAGRYYFTAVLEVETLTLSDFDELERWLQGELQPAITGRRPVGSAIGQGARRLVIRLLRLPAKRYESRSSTFEVH
jgi:hypothetical protein